MFEHQCKTHNYFCNLNKKINPNENKKVVSSKTFKDFKHYIFLYCWFTTCKLKKNISVLTVIIFFFMFAR